MLTFEEWFDKEYAHWEDKDEYYYDFREHMKKAWEAGYEEGCADSDPAAPY